MVLARIAASARVHPPLTDMVDALHRNQEETIDILPALPVSHVAHRGTYWRLGRTPLEDKQPSSHIQEHAAPIRAAVASA